MEDTLNIRILTSDEREALREAALEGPLHYGELPVDPAIVLGTLAYVERLEAENTSLLLQLEEAKKEKEPEGDGGVWALQRLASYFYEAGPYEAYAHVRAAAHNAGWCIDDGGADRIEPTTGVCELCGYSASAEENRFVAPQKEREEA